MKYGYYSDNELVTLAEYPFRCPSWTPMPEGKKNVVILGCSHTWGVGLATNETWAHHVSQHNTDRLRYWNLGQPGASPETVVRILYSCEKVLHPNIIIVMWPESSRRERLDKYVQNLNHTSDYLKFENDNTDTNNFLKCVFFLEKYAEKNQCKTIHCFSDDYVEFRSKGNSPLVFENHTLKNCWPYWDKFEQRERPGPSLARDGIHYGIENHKHFSQLFLDQFKNKLR